MWYETATVSCDFEFLAVFNFTPLLSGLLGLAPLRCLDRCLVPRNRSHNRTRPRPRFLKVLIAAACFNRSPF